MQGDDIGLGAVLREKWRSEEYFSKKTNDSQKKQSACELELNFNKTASITLGLIIFITT